MADLDPRLAEMAWPYNETDDLGMDPAALIVFAEDAQKLVTSDRIVVLDGRRYAVTAEEPRGDHSINACLVPVEAEDARLAKDATS